MLPAPAPARSGGLLILQVAERVAAAVMSRRLRLGKVRHRRGGKTMHDVHDISQHLGEVSLPGHSRGKRRGRS